MKHNKESIAFIDHVSRACEEQAEESGDFIKDLLDRISDEMYLFIQNSGKKQLKKLKFKEDAFKEFIVETVRTSITKHCYELISSNLSEKKFGVDEVISDFLRDLKIKKDYIKEKKSKKLNRKTLHPDMGAIVQSLSDEQWDAYSKMRSKKVNKK